MFDALPPRQRQDVKLGWERFKHLKYLELPVDCNGRKFLYLENVKSILSKQHDMKRVMHFLIKVPHLTCLLQVEIVLILLCSLRLLMLW